MSGTGPRGRAWSAAAIRALHDEGRGCRPTPLRPVPLPDGRRRLWLKDESAHPTGTLKHRTVRALYCHAVSGGAVDHGTPVVTATGGPVAVAAAYFAGLLDLPHTALVPPRTPSAMRERIEAQGGLVRDAEGPPAALQQEAGELARAQGGHLLDHFAHAEPAVAACGEPTIADEVFGQLREGGHPAPDWIVTGAATGATSAAFGRYLRRHAPAPAGEGCAGTRLAVADPEHSAYFPGWAGGVPDYATGMPSRIPGVGRPRVEPGFLAGAIDLVVPVPDAASVAAMRWLAEEAGVAAGPGTGTVVWAAGRMLERLREDGAPGSVVAVLGDRAEPYRETFGDPSWTASRGLDPQPYTAQVRRLMTGQQDGQSGP